MIIGIRTGYQWKMLPKEYGSGSTYHIRFQELRQSDKFDIIWTRLLKIQDNKREKEKERKESNGTDSKSRQFINEITFTRQ